MENFLFRKAMRLFRMATAFSLASLLWPQAAIPQSADEAFENALSALIAFDNETLEDIVSNQPALLLAEDARGRTLVEHAFLFVNDDLAPQTNTGFIEYLIENDFFGQPVDRSEHFSLAAASLRMVDRHARRAELTEDMIFHKSRLPLVSLLSSVVEDRITANSFGSEESMEMVLAVCDPAAIEGGEVDHVSSSVSTALRNTLTRKNTEYIAVFLSVGTLDKRCVEALLS